MRRRVMILKRALVCLPILGAAVNVPLTKRRPHMPDLGINITLRYVKDKRNRAGMDGDWELVKGSFPSTFKPIPYDPPIKKWIKYKNKCVETEAEFSAVKHLINTRNRTSPFVSLREKLYKVPKKMQCGRAIIDGKFKEKELKAVEKIVGVDEFGRNKVTSLDVHLNLRHKMAKWSGIDKIKDILEEHYGLEQRPRLSYILHYDNRAAGIPCSLHSDLLSNTVYLFTVILYLVNQKPGECGRCETAFIDSVDEDGFVKEGIAIQPRRGRLGTWTGGIENLHCRVEGNTGDRSLLMMWFDTRSQIGDLVDKTKDHLEL